MSFLLEIPRGIIEYPSYKNLLLILVIDRKEGKHYQLLIKK